MKYKAVKLKTCPFCHKKGMSYITDICYKCGKNISNRCEGKKCGAPLDGAARYCKTCGEKSLYFSLGLLSCWISEYEDV